MSKVISQGMVQWNLEKSKRAAKRHGILLRRNGGDRILKRESRKVKEREGE